jgi:hypothetical protein
VPTGKKYRIMSISECSSEFERWRQPGVVFFAGSLVSTFNPTSLPIGTHITEGFWNFIFGEAWPRWLKEDFEYLPFEALMQCHPARDSLRVIVRQMFQDAQANLIHEKLVAGLLNGTIKAVITTNYDTAFEACTAEGSGVTTITTCAEAKAYQAIAPPAHPGAIFKIHGTARAGLESTLVYDLEGEGRILPWKRDLLLGLVAGRTVIALGYSGRDFDICPELADANASEVVWLQRKPDDLQPNAERVLDKQPRGLLMVGELLDFLRTFTGESVDALPSTATWRPESYFRDTPVTQWRRLILDWMACPALLDLREPSLELIAGDERANMLGHTGRYRDASRILQGIAKHQGVPRQKRITAELRAAEQWFIYGRCWRGWRMLQRVELQLTAEDKDFRVLAAELHLFMYAGVALFAQQFHITRLRRYICRRSIILYQAARDALETKGEWRRLASLRQNAERIGIPQTGLPLPAVRGYASLGLILMDATAKRDSIRSGEMTQAQYEKALNCICKAERYGWHTEAWKLHWMLIWRGHNGSKLVDRAEHFIGWWEHFRKTQYPPLGRVFQLVINFPTDRERNNDPNATCLEP